MLILDYQKYYISGTSIPKTSMMGEQEKQKLKNITKRLCFSLFLICQHQKHHFSNEKLNFSNPKYTRERAYQKLQTRKFLLKNMVSTVGC